MKSKIFFIKKDKSQNLNSINEFIEDKNIEKIEYIPETWVAIYWNESNIHKIDVSNLTIKEQTIFLNLLKKIQGNKKWTG